MGPIGFLLSGLGLFFIGVRGLSANLVPLIGRRARAAFAHALKGSASSAISGMIAGMVTQSSTAVSWIIVSFVRGGVLPDGPALMAPTWANVGTALLPLIVAIDTATPAAIVIGLVGFATYFKLARGDRMRNALEAALGGALLLFGMHLVSIAVGPMRESLMGNPLWAIALGNPWLLAGIGAAFAFAAQSSSVAAAIAVAAVSGGLLDISAALPLLAGANFASSFNNMLMIPGEATSGRIVFALQAVQKIAGSVLLALLCLGASQYPDHVSGILGMAGEEAGAQVAIVFLLTQIGGAFITNLVELPTRRLLLHLLPANPAETLAQPVFLLRAASADPATALDLSLRELARLTARLPLMLDHVRDDADTSTPPAATLKIAGQSLAGTIKAYLATLLDGALTREQVASALLIDEGASDVGALHEALAEFAEAAREAQGIDTAQRLIEALHAILYAVADHGESLGTEDASLVLGLLGHRDHLMEELRQRLSAQYEIAPAAQNALFRMTMLFERIVWTARRLVNDFTQAHRSIDAS
ncbi:Na+/Picotransporter [Ancylobacter radicis]|uniref:Na+/Picotransporter n=1 Tax=Ancylobacter radicis TaxID=2836179 RepID=A0ABS5R397_9HYPH|nr:Na+/Picotransporter [Ancylobacter radicis]MBS9476134.1 Na+/Picotransporter [Ancylobacter radicis]